MATPRKIKPLKKVARSVAKPLVVSVGSVSPIEWPENLVIDLARRWSVVVVGSGVSCQSRNAKGLPPKSWAEFLEAALKEASCRGCVTDAKHLISQRDYLTACELIKGTMAADFTTFVKKEFATAGFKAAQIHRHIVGLDSRFVLTPNFDKIYDTCANQMRDSSIMVKSYHEKDVADFVRSRDRCVLKVHGTIDSPGEMIFTRSEYARARSAYSSFYSVLEALILTHTFLFVGCGLDDPDIRMLLEDYAFRHFGAKPHYYVIPNDRMSSMVASAIEKSLNVKFLTYDPADGHSQLAKGLEALEIQVGLARTALLTSGEW